MYTIGQSGIGSDMHIISWGLAVAMDSNRIFVRFSTLIFLIASSLTCVALKYYSPGQAWRWADGEFCKTTHTPDCYFLPLSNCTPPDDRIVPYGGGKVQEYPVIVSIEQNHAHYHMWHLPPVCFFRFC